MTKDATAARLAAAQAAVAAIAHISLMDPRLSVSEYRAVEDTHRELTAARKAHFATFLTAA